MKKIKNSELNRKSISEFRKSKKLPIIIILENIRSAHNVGSVFRNSDAFMIEKIFLCGITPCPPNRQIKKTALGATNSIKWAYHKDSNYIIKKFKKEGYNIISVEQVKKSIKLNEFENAVGLAIELLNKNPEDAIPYIMSELKSDNIIKKTILRQ